MDYPLALLEVMDQILRDEERARRHAELARRGR
jgi:hypothetical protein